jgi:hypothetical protein
VSSDAARLIAEASAEAFRAAVQRSVANAIGAAAAAAGGGGNALPGGAHAMGALPSAVYGLPTIPGGAPTTDLEWTRMNHLLGMARQFPVQQGAGMSNGVFPPAPPGQDDVRPGENGNAGAPGCCVM